MSKQRCNYVCTSSLFLNRFIFHFWDLTFLFSTLLFFQHFQHLSSCNFNFMCMNVIISYFVYLFKSFWFIYLPISFIYKQAGGGVWIGSTGASGTFISCSWSGNTAPTDKVSTIVSILLLLLPLLINHSFHKEQR